MDICRLVQFHENPMVIAWWCARLGWALDWLTPFRRRAILAAIALCIGAISPFIVLIYRKKEHMPPDPSGGVVVAIVLLALFAILWLVYRAAARFSTLPDPVRHHPLLTLNLLYWGAVAVLWNSVSATETWRAVLLGIAFVFPLIIWRCCYLLLAGQRGQVAGTRFTDHLIYLWPTYGGTGTSIAMGYGHLTQHEAKTVEELARYHLAGIRLILLGLLCGALFYVFEGFVYVEKRSLTKALFRHTAGINVLGELVKEGGAAPIGMAWASIYCELFKQVLRLASGGHVAIGILRLFGFNLFRNTYKPLLAESVQEFWNRYYYYFKELLVRFFFMPVFMQLGGKLRDWPRLRLFVAVFAAAFVGNIYYHLLERGEFLVQGDMFGALYSLRSDVFYAFLLATGIYVSMLRTERRGGKPLSSAPVARITRIFGVWTFFSLVIIWDVKSSASFFTRVHFFLNLFCIS